MLYRCSLRHTEKEKGVHMRLTDFWDTLYWRSIYVCYSCLSRLISRGGADIDVMPSVLMSTNFTCQMSPCVGYFATSRGSASRCFASKMIL